MQRRWSGKRIKKFGAARNAVCHNLASTRLDQSQRRHCISDSLLAYLLKLQPAKNHAQHYNMQLWDHTRVMLQCMSVVLQS